MDMSNSLIASGYQPPTLTSVSPAERQAKQPIPNQNVSKDAYTVNGKQGESDSLNINAAEFIKKGEAVQTERLRRIDALDHAPFKGQQAVNSYQQTLDAAQQYEQGELVGIDLFV